MGHTKPFPGDKDFDRDLKLGVRALERNQRRYEQYTRLDDHYFSKNSFKLTVIAGLIAIGCAVGGCYAVQWLVGL